MSLIGMPPYLYNLFWFGFVLFSRQLIMIHSVQNNYALLCFVKNYNNNNIWPKSVRFR
jgi:hypothetical protein